MNPYRTKQARYKEDLDAAKERFRQHTNSQLPKKPFHPYAPEKPSSYSNLEKRVEIVRSMPEGKLERSLQTREIQTILGVQNLKGTAKNRAINSVLVAAGKRPLRKQTVEVMKTMYAGGKATGQVRDEPYMAMLEMTGVIETIRFGGGKRAFTIKDKEKLKRVINEGKIIW